MLCTHTRGLFGYGHSVPLSHTNDRFPSVPKILNRTTVWQTWNPQRAPVRNSQDWPFLKKTSEVSSKMERLPYTNIMLVSTYPVETDGRLPIQTGFMRVNSGKLETTVSTGGTVTKRDGHFSFRFCQTGPREIARFSFPARFSIVLSWYITHLPKWYLALTCQVLIVGY